MVAPADMNKYSRYYEARVYVQAPFRSRPFDMFAIVSTHTAYSRDTIRTLVAAGKTVWHNSNTITASYTLRPWKGFFLTSGLNYITGPAITPHVPNALTVSLQSNLFF